MDLADDDWDLADDDWEGVMAKLYRADGTETTVNPKGKKWTLEELQNVVGGYIEMMPGVGTLKMVLDEEGRLKGKPVNLAATEMVQIILQGKPLRYNPVICGDVLVLDKGERV